MHGYSTRQVAELIGMSPAKIRSFARDDFLQPERLGGRGYRFSFQDIVLLRAAKSLEDARISPRKVRRALRALRDALPARQPLTALRITAQGDEVVVREDETAWQPESGQATFDFNVAELVPGAAPLVLAAAQATALDDRADAEDWFALALDLETVGAMDEAGQTYQRALEVDPAHVDTQINLGRLKHAQGLPAEAAVHYRQALECEPEHTTAHFNLGVALEDLALFDEAAAAYERAIAVDPDNADAHFNLARLHEAAGRRPAAFRHLARYRALIKQAQGPAKE